MILKKNKRIGKVLFIVEGGKYEFSLLKKIFVDILDYDMVEKRRDNVKYYKHKKDSHSCIAIINTKTSNIKSIEDGENYLDKIYAELIEKYDFDIDNSSIFYLFDRDVKSNTDVDFIKNILHKLKNSRENDDNISMIEKYP